MPYIHATPLILYRLEKQLEQSLAHGMTDISQSRGATSPTPVPSGISAELLSTKLTPQLPCTVVVWENSAKTSFMFEEFNRVP